MPCEVLRQCSATNPADIIIYVDCTRLKKNHFFFMPILTLLFVRLCVYYINTL